MIPYGLGTARRDVGALPGDVNVFHGGPIVLGVSPTSGVEGGPAVTVRGRNLAPGDAVAIEGLPAPTRFVDAATLTFTPPAIASGRKTLQIRRGYRSSNGTSFDVRASLARGAPRSRVTPGAYAELKGTGFGPGITATVDGRPTTVSVFDTHTLEVRVRRPARPPVDTDRRGEPVTVEVFDLGTSLGTVDVTVDTFRIASLGDSVVWGQGLLEPQKFSMLVADTLTARYNGSIAVFATDRCAHSGARIAPSAGDGPDPQAPRLPGDFAGECLSRVPSVTAQVAGWTAGTLAAGQGGEIDLVILDGGANDVGIFTIMNPGASDPALSAAITAACFTGMGTLLARVRATFPGAAIVVTGYYPIVSTESDMRLLFPVVGALGLLTGALLGSVVVPLVPGAGPVGFGPLETAVVYEWARGRLITRSAIFATIANTSLAAAVAAAGPRVALAVPAFDPRTRSSPRTRTSSAPDCPRAGWCRSTRSPAPGRPPACRRTPAPRWRPSATRTRGAPGRTPMPSPPPCPHWASSSRRRTDCPQSQPALIPQDQQRFLAHLQKHQPRSRRRPSRSRPTESAGSVQPGVTAGVPECSTSRQLLERPPDCGQSAAPVQLETGFGTVQPLALAMILVGSPAVPV